MTNETTKKKLRELFIEDLGQVKGGTTTLLAAEEDMGPSTTYPTSEEGAGGPGPIDSTHAEGEEGDPWPPA